jgi:hypothetical protein
MCMKTTTEGTKMGTTKAILCRECEIDDRLFPGRRNPNVPCVYCNYLRTRDPRTQRQIELDRQVTEELNRETADMIRSGSAKAVR